MVTETEINLELPSVTIKHGPMRCAVEEALGSVVLPPRARPGAELVRRYADLVDGGADVMKVGPRIMATLRDLGLGAAGEGPPAPPKEDGHDPRRESHESARDRARERRAASRHAVVKAAHA